MLKIQMTLAGSLHIYNAEESKVLGTFHVLDRRPIYWGPRVTEDEKQEVRQHFEHAGIKLPE